MVAFWRTPVPVQLMVRLPALWETLRTGQLTVTVNVQRSEAPAAFLASTVTSVTPGGKRLPEGGLAVTVK